MTGKARAYSGKGTPKHPGLGWATDLPFLPPATTTIRIKPPPPPTKPPPINSDIIDCQCLTEAYVVVNRLALNFLTSSPILHLLRERGWYCILLRYPAYHVSQVFHTFSFDAMSCVHASWAVRLGASRRGAIGGIFAPCPLPSSRPTVLLELGSASPSIRRISHKQARITHPGLENVSTSGEIVEVSGKRCSWR